MATEKKATAEVTEKPADEPKAAEEARPVVEPKASAAEVDQGPFTALATFLRNGEEVEVGETITFGKGEADHVRELLGMGVLHSGGGADARKAVESAEAARDIARHTPPS
jgi:hypothetical protein